MATEPLTPAQHYDEGMTLLREAGHQNIDREERMIRAQRAQGHFQAGVLVAVMEQVAEDDTT